MECVAVRPFEATDLIGAAKALVAVHETDGYPVEGVKDPQAWIRSDEVMAAWVAEAHGSIVGHAAIMHPRGEDAVCMWVEQSGDTESQVAVLARLFVVQAARRNATGERLVVAAMRYARENGLRLVLDVMAKDAAAVRLYERLGWRRTGEAVHHFGAGQSIPAVCYVAPGA